MEDFKNRLQAFIKGNFPSVRAFEKECGLTNGTIGSIGPKGPSVEVLSKISDKCPELNLNWLFSGEGSMQNEKIDQIEEQSYPAGINALPLIPSEAFAGPGMPSYDDLRVEDYYTVSDFKNSDFLIRVTGDSMSPKYCGGDIVACKKISETYFFQWGRVYVIYTQSQGIMIKRVQPSEDRDFITCVSDNPKYAPFDVPKSDIVSIALVNGAITLE